MYPAEFQEIAHCGGQIIFTITNGPAGERQLQVGIQHSRPNPASWIAVYALPQGNAIAYLPIGGMGVQFPPPPIPGAYMVFISSDTHGMFGHSCPKCGQYWRSNGVARCCPYCGLRADIHHFLSVAQRKYVAEYCSRLNELLSGDEEGEYVIDMDAVAEAVGKDSPKPEFYYSDESQQTRFECSSCKTPMDILGHYGYCSYCRTRNDLQQLDVAIRRLREAANNDAGFEACSKQAVGLFDSFANQIAKQLLEWVPMTRARKHTIEKRSLHNLEAIARDFKSVFDIDLFDGMSDEDVTFAKMMFYRRNVYEHNGGEVDQAYIENSGETSVKPKQALRETKESFHRLATTIRKLGENLYLGFHEIFPPIPGRK